MTAALVLADDHPIVLDGLRRLFEAEPGWQVKACCRDGVSALRAVEEHRPNLLVLDLQMPRLSGVDVIQDLTASGDPTPIVVLTAGVDNDHLLKAVRLGAHGILLKDRAPSVLLECARTVLEGRTFLDSEVVQLLLTATAELEATDNELLQRLTARELEISRLAMAGLRSKEIAAQLRISEGTVKVHLHNTYQKLGVTNRVGLSNRLRAIAQADACVGASRSRTPTGRC